MRRVVLGAVSAIALTASANAADMYHAPEGVGGFKDTYVPVDTWTGFYAGVNGGYAWDANSDQFSHPAANPCAPTASCPYAAFGGLNPTGGFGGGQIGYNWQGIWHPHLVLGVEADIQGAGITDSATDPKGGIDKENLDWFGTVRGRLGYAMDRALIYATGGFAYGGLQSSVDNGTYKFDGTATGYAVGGGVEYKFTHAWSAKLEYQYLDFGKNDPTNSAGVTASSAGYKVDEDAFHTVRAGLNYHFGNTYEPLK